LCTFHWDGALFFLVSFQTHLGKKRRLLETRKAGKGVADGKERQKKEREKEERGRRTKNREEPRRLARFSSLARRAGQGKGAGVQDKGSVVRKKIRKD
jgi:hypothetical protein